MAQQRNIINLCTFYSGHIFRTLVGTFVGTFGSTFFGHLPEHYFRTFLGHY